MKSYEVEICLDNPGFARSAQAYGADRVELCARLDLDGITPSPELIAATRASAPDLDLYVMIRPPGGFCYGSAALEKMLSEIEMAISLGADGIVAGALLEDGHLDVSTTQQLLEAAGKLPFTYHRAFDVCQDPLRAAQKLKTLGVSRILTSGQAPTAPEGVPMLKNLLAQPSIPDLMAGSGVSGKNIPQLWEAGIRQFHFTCHRKVGTLGFDEAKAKEAFASLQAV